jgi:hypothetical protein
MNVPTPPRGASGQERRGPSPYERFFEVSIPAVAPLFAVFWLVGADRLERYPLAVQVVLVALAFVSGLVPAALVFTPGFREKWLRLNFYRPGRWWGFLVPALNTWWFCVIVTSWGFALVSGFLYVHGVGTTDPDRALNDPFTNSWTVYIWTLLSAFEIPQLIGWEPRFRFTDHVNPVLILLYKICVVSPVFAIARRFWNDRPRKGS